MLECLPIENIAEESADSDYKVIVLDVLDSLAVVNKTYKENEITGVLGVCINICVESESKKDKDSSKFT